MFKKIAIILIILSIPCILVQFVHAGNFNSCVKCHHVEDIGTHHNFSCLQCHVLAKYRKDVYSHKLVVKNPSSLKYVNVFCAKCHKQDIYNIEHSLHGTLSGSIAITRYLWGAQNTLKPHYGMIAVGNLKALPALHDYPAGKKPKDLVNNFLRRKCLRCHLLNNGTDKGVGALDLYRLKGCAACHMPVSAYGRYLGEDKVLYGKSVYSKYHRFLKVPPMHNCLSCHNTEFVGTDYKGLFPHDFPYSFNSPILKSGTFPPSPYGIEFHHLISDVHFREGMTCVDCHRKSGVMGDGRLYASESVKGALKVTCQDCHGGFLKNPSEKWVTRIDKKYYFTGVYGHIWKLKIFNKNLIPHKLYHKNVSCSACHAAWQNENYQYNALLSYKPNYLMWQNLTDQEDPYLSNFLNNAIKGIKLGKTPPKPQMPDRITEKMYPGIWYFGWLMRRWSYFTLGLTNYGEYKILRPLFQYRLSYVNNKGRVIINDIRKTSNGRVMGAFIPYDPHTITLYGKSCADCHNNKFIFNSGRISGTVQDEILNGQVLFGKQLSEKEKKKLESEFYKKIRSHMFMKTPKHALE